MLIYQRVIGVIIFLLLYNLMIYYYWLVVYLPLWKIWQSVGIIMPNIWKNKKCSKPPTRLLWLWWSGFLLRPSPWCPWSLHESKPKADSWNIIEHHWTACGNGRKKRCGPISKQNNISKYQNIMEYCHNKTTDDLPVIKHHKNGTTPRRNLQRISGADVSTICPTNSPG